MVKILALTFLLMLPFSNAWALEGIIVSFEAPLFQKPHPRAPIIQRFRRGAILTLHKQTETDLFYQTTDRNGRAAYILKKHIKLITGDALELESPMISFAPDLTDYRIKEPLPKNYPFKPLKKYRSAAAFSLSFPKTQAYQYAQGPQTINSSRQTQFSLQWSKEAALDERSPRLYFGGFLRFSYEWLHLTFPTSEQAWESSVLLSLGPLLSYDLLRAHRHRLVLLGGIGVDLINYYQVQIQDDVQLFKAISLTPMLSFQYQRKEVFKGLDLTIGPTVHLILLQKFKSSRGPYNGALWGQQRSFKRNLAIGLTLNLGLQFNSM